MSFRKLHWVLAAVVLGVALIRIISGDLIGALLPLFLSALFVSIAADYPLLKGARRTWALLRRWLWLVPLLAPVQAQARTAGEDPALILLYNGLGTEARARLWGRVVVDPGLAPPGKEEGKLAKLRRTIAVMESDELPRAKVELSVLGRRVRATADDEGFFTLDLAGPLKQGNHRVNARLLGKSRKYRAPPGRLLIWPRKPGIAVISDIDDTVLQTGVTSKARMLRKVLFSNAHDLNSYSNAPSLYRVWAGRGYPVVYVSGSPFNLYPRIIGFMRLKGFPQSPLFLKNFGTDSLTEQVAYKLSRIGQAMALLPGYRFILVGDSGEKDPEVYRQVQGLHPKQVMATLIHRVTNEDMTSLRFKGQLLFNFYSGLARVLKEKGLLNAKELKIVEGTP